MCCCCFDVVVCLFGGGGIVLLLLFLCFFLLLFSVLFVCCCCLFFLFVFFVVFFFWGGGGVVGGKTKSQSSPPFRPFFHPALSKQHLSPFPLSCLPWGLFPDRKMADKERWTCGWVGGEGGGRRWGRESNDSAKAKQSVTGGTDRSAFAIYRPVLRSAV